MRKFIALALLLILCISSADFLIEKVDVTISDIKPDGSTKVHETIKFIMYGNYSKTIYDGAISRNDLSYWSSITNLSEIRLHTNPAKVSIEDLRVRPQPRTKCNPIQGICHGELILDYLASPAFNNASQNMPVFKTGLFSVIQYKPRTKRYSLNPNSLAFTTSSDGNIILSDNTFLNIILPEGAVLLDVNPQPSDTILNLPTKVNSLTWSDIILVKSSMVFDVEEGIDKEVSDFFSGILIGSISYFSSPFGIAFLLLIIIIIGSYFYIKMHKRRGDD